MIYQREVELMCNLIPDEILEIEARMSRSRMFHYGARCHNNACRQQKDVSYYRIYLPSTAFSQYALCLSCVSVLGRRVKSSGTRVVKVS
jgi:hypothetical protein